MFKRYLAAVAALAFVAVGPALADYAVKDGTGASQTFGSFTLSGIQFPKHVMVDPSTGAAIGVSSAPFYAQITNFPATQAVSAASLPLPAGAATAALQSTIAANQNSTAAGVSATSGQGMQGVTGGVPVGVTVGPYGLGAMAAVPGASSTGTPLSASPPAGKRGARLYVPPGASITFTVASAQPSSAPSATITVANPSANTIPTNWDEDLNGQMIYVTAVTGSPLFRWY